MTSTGHPPDRRASAMALIVAVAAMAAVIVAAPPAQAMADGPLDRTWTDSRTGLAIAGYDPVAYFTEGRPVPGSRDHEHVWQGVAWRFASAANKAVFAEAPELYAPRFGGYSAIGVARGEPSQGSPVIWSITADRLYLFHNAAHKALWQDAPEQWLKQAGEAWPAIARRIARSR